MGHRGSLEPRPRATVLLFRPVVLGALLLAGACGQPREWRSSLDLADYVSHQEQNLTTDLISPPEGIGSDSIGSGWRLREDGEENEPLAEMRRRLGRVRLFSADTDLTSLEVELGLTPDAGSETVEVALELNTEPLADLEIAQRWSTHRMDVPPDLVRSGLNVLDVRHRDMHPEGPFVRLRRVRLFSSSGRTLWRRRPDRITVRTVGVGPKAERRVEMPTASRLDMLLRVPEEGELTGSFSLQSAPGDTLAPVEVSVKLLDERGHWHTLVDERVEGDLEPPRSVAVDLERWSGELACLRWGVTGSGNALLRWHGAGVRSTEPGLEPPPPPIRRVVPNGSGRLGRPDVIVIMLDAARADAFSPFGGPHATPAVARLAAGGTVFRQAQAGSSWTLPSVTGLLTGLHADAVGVGAWTDRLPDEVPTLPELMTAAGYKTVLFSQHPFYLYDESFTRGFRRFRVLEGDQTATLPLRRELMARDQSTFTLVHLLPPHTPYTPPAPFRGRYSSGYTGEMKVDDLFLNTFRASPGRRSDADVRYVLDRYLENVAYADSLVGRVLANLDRHGRYDDALIVLLSDHGEAFMEHGRFLHSPNLYREVLHVPLVIKWPRSVSGFRRVVDEPVSLLDLLPSLVDGLSLTGAGDGFQGRSLLPMVFEGQSSERPFYAVTRGANDPNQTAAPGLMLELGGWRVHFAPLDARTELYRVDRDPLEKNDLAPKRLVQALLLRQSLLIQSAWNRDLLQRTERDQAGGDLDPEQIQQLNALGYLN